MKHTQHKERGNMSKSLAKKETKVVQPKKEVTKPVFKTVRKVPSVVTPKETPLVINGSIKKAAPRKKPSAPSLPKRLSIFQLFNKMFKF